MSQYCERFRCYVGPEFCKLCPEKCDNPSLKKETLDERELSSNGLCKRREAIKLVERNLEAAYLYASTGHPLHSDCEWKEDVPSAECVPVVEGEGEINNEVGSILDRELNL